MNATQIAVMNRKAAALDRITPTVAPSAGNQSVHTRGFQVDTPQPLPAYPAPGAAAIEVVRYQVPAAMTGKLSLLAIVNIGGAFVDGSGNVLWHVFRNGAPVKGLENLYAQIGTLAQPSQLDLLLAQNDLLQVLVEIPAGKVAPAGNPFARFVGFLDYGGPGNQAPRSYGAGPAGPTTAPAAAPSSGSGGAGTPAPAPTSPSSGSNTSTNSHIVNAEAL